MVAAAWGGWPDICHLANSPSICSCINQSVHLSINQSISWPVSYSIVNLNPSISQPVNHPIDPSFSLSQPAHESINLPTYPVSSTSSGGSANNDWKNVIALTIMCQWNMHVDMQAAVELCWLTCVSSELNGEGLTRSGGIDILGSLLARCCTIMPKDVPANQPAAIMTTHALRTCAGMAIFTNAQKELASRCSLLSQSALPCIIVQHGGTVLHSIVNTAS